MHCMVLYLSVPVQVLEGSLGDYIGWRLGLDPSLRHVVCWCMG